MPGLELPPAQNVKEKRSALGPAPRPPPGGHDSSLGDSVGFVGWRGMVGSVLINACRRRGLRGHHPGVLLHLQRRRPGPVLRRGTPEGTLQDAYDLDTLAKLPIVVTAQGGDYT